MSVNHQKTGGEKLVDKQKVTMPDSLNANASDLFNQLKIRRKHRYLIFRLDDAGDVHAEHVGEPKATPQEFISKMPPTDCRFAIFDLETKTNDGRITSKLFFISWLPNNATPHKKMGYTAAKAVFREKFTGVFDVMAKVEKDLQVCLQLCKEDEDDGDESDASWEN